MIVVRDIFRIKFGKTKEATSLWKQALALLRGAGFSNARLLTDVAGAPYYTIVLETTHESLGRWEQAGKDLRNNPQWSTIYQQITPLTDEGRREIFSVIE